MPNRWPISSGNWSNAAIWSGSLIPTASDDVFTNNQIVTVDQNINIRSLQNLPTGSAIGDGSFISTNGISVTCSVGIIAASGSLFIVTGSDSVNFSSSFSTTGTNAKSGSLLIRTTGIVNIIGNVTASGAANSNTIIMQTPGTLTITGSLINNSSGTATNAHGIFIITGSLFALSGSLIGTVSSTFTNYNLRISGSCPVVITGSINGGRTQSVYNQLNPQPVNIQGNCSVVATGGASTITIQHQAAGSMNINGNLYANGAGAVVTNTGVGTLNVSGNLTSDQGGGNQPNIITNTSTGTVIVTGSVTTGTTLAAISSTTAGTIIVNGPIYANNNAPGISSTSTSATVRVTGPLINQNNVNAVYSPKIQLISTSTPTYEFQTDTFPRDVIFYDAAYTSSLPSQTNVRSGSMYGGSNEFSGSMVIPSTGSVRYGVPVDNTTGSAANITPQDIFDYAVTSLTGSNTIGERLKNISTTQTTAATIAAFKGK